jgi:hypothetical protein
MTTIIEAHGVAKRVGAPRRHRRGCDRPQHHLLDPAERRLVHRDPRRVLRDRRRPLRSHPLMIEHSTPLDCCGRPSRDDARTHGPTYSNMVQYALWGRNLHAITQHTACATTEKLRLGAVAR